MVGSDSNKPSIDTNPDLDTLDSEDWKWLRTNDHKIRARRKSIGYDTLSMNTPNYRSQSDEALIHQKHALPEDHQALEIDIRTSSNDEKHVDVYSALIHEDAFSANELDELSQTLPWNDSEWQDDKAQAAFEAQLKSSEKEQQTHPAFEQEFTTLDDDFDYAFDDHFEVTKVVDETERTAFDWAEFVFEADEFDATPDRGIPMQKVRTTGQVSRHQRAKQQATIIGQRFSWDKAGIELLTDVFTRYGWSSAKRAMQRELEKGLTPAELEVAIQIREFWCECSEFSTNFGWRQLWTNSVCGVSRDDYNALSWPTAIQIIRLTNSLPDAAEIQHLLDELYSIWYSSNRLHHFYPSFHYYLNCWLSYVSDQPDMAGIWAASVDRQFESDFDEDNDKFDPGYTTPENQMLAQCGLLSASIVNMVEDYYCNSEIRVFGKALVLRSMQIQ